MGLLLYLYLTQEISQEFRALQEKESE